ncbi:MAG: hypothetical protein QF864_08860 [SAR202 cluster bacterium]|nr:hypothetical protein [SAR202 cluster bacterium]
MNVIEKLPPLFHSQIFISFSELIDTIANLASGVNSTVKNMVARRLHAIIERVLDEISFTANNRSGEKIVIEAVDKTMYLKKYQVY